MRAVLRPVPIVCVAARPGEGASAVPEPPLPAPLVLGAVHVLAGAQAILQVLRPLPCTHSSGPVSGMPSDCTSVQREETLRAKPDACTPVTPVLCADHVGGASVSF